MSVDASAKLTLALILAFSCTTSVSALNMSHVCALTGDGTMLSSGDACNTYYLCSGGVAQLQTCDSPYYFSKNQQQCVPQTEVNCLGNGQDPCEGRNVGTWVGVPGSCSGFYYCSAKGAQRSNCPSNENFDPYSQTCKYNSDYPCGNTGTGDGPPSNVPVYTNLCTYIQNGLYYGSPSNCQSWNLCVNNVMTTGICEKELVFNVNLHTCDYASDWGCSQITNDPDLVGPVANNGGPCTNRGDMKAATSCTGYYICDGTTFQLLNCQNGLYYDPPSQTCVNRLSARNNCDRCAGTTDSFVNQFSTVSCSGYLFCQNSVEKSEGACQQGYFDEVAGACVVGQQPEYACCNPSVDGTTAAPTSTTTDSITPPIATTGAITEATTKDGSATDATTKEGAVTEATTKEAAVTEATTQAAAVTEATTQAAAVTEATTLEPAVTEATTQEPAVTEPTTTTLKA